jgi:hypothetical protein
MPSTARPGRCGVAATKVRSRNLGASEEVVDLVGNVEEPDRAYATTPGGVRMSDDGGMAFTTLTQPRCCPT